jgi:hypothetical protein
MSILMVRSRRASMYSLAWSLRYSGSLVLWQTMLPTPQTKLWRPSQAMS